MGCRFAVLRTATQIGRWGAEPPQVKASTKSRERLAQQDALAHAHDDYAEPVEWAEFPSRPLPGRSHTCLAFCFRGVASVGLEGPMTTRRGKRRQRPIGQIPKLVPQGEPPVLLNNTRRGKRRCYTIRRESPRGGGILPILKRLDFGAPMAQLYL
jgi:hypothetical protein